MRDAGLEMRLCLLSSFIPLSLPVHQAAVMGRPTLQSQLVKELVQFGDIGAAAHWAIQCNIPLEYLPLAVQSCLTSHRVRCVKLCHSLSSLSIVNYSLAYWLISLLTLCLPFEHT